MPVLNFKIATAEMLKIFINKGFVRNAMPLVSCESIVFWTRMIYIVFVKTSADLNNAHVK